MVEYLYWIAYNKRDNYGYCVTGQKIISIMLQFVIIKVKLSSNQGDLIW